MDCDFDLCCCSCVPSWPLLLWDCQITYYALMLFYFIFNNLVIYIMYMGTYKHCGFIFWQQKSLQSSSNSWANSFVLPRGEILIQAVCDQRSLLRTSILILRLYFSSRNTAEIQAVSKKWQYASFHFCGSESPVLTHLIHHSSLLTVSVAQFAGEVGSSFVCRSIVLVALRVLMKWGCRIVV